MRRALSVFLPNLPLDRLKRRLERDRTDDEAFDALVEGRALVLAEGGARGLRVTAATRAARGLSVHPGLALADAGARAPSILVRPADPAGDAKTLQGLAHWAMRRFSPTAGVDGADGLILDVEGCAHLFGGEPALCEAVETGLAALGFSARLGLAGGRAAAWAAARHLAQAGEAALIPSGAERQMLGGVAIEALRLTPETAHVLRRLGLRRVEDLLRLPREGLAHRFKGEAKRPLSNALARLDALFGRRAEPITGVTEAARFEAMQAFAEPLIDPQGLAYALPRLAETLARRLEEGRKGARRLLFIAERADGSKATLEAALAAPSREADHFARLFVERLGVIDPGFGVDRLRLCAPEAEDLAPAQAQIDVDAERREAEARLIDRLTARLGPGAVRRAVPVESHRPERAVRFAPAGERAESVADFHAGPAGPPPSARPARPVVLFDPPEPVEADRPDRPGGRFLWRRVERRVTRVRGPERLSPEWWRAFEAAPPRRREGVRDYWVAEDEAGRRYWLFEEAGAHEPRWFLHGAFA